MNNYNTYDVAVMNYPLFDHKQNTEYLQNRIFASPMSDDAEVPIYVHIPFCDSLCDFCIYNRKFALQNSDIINKYVKALIKEIKLYSNYNYIKNRNIGSVFIGGGTPTVLNEIQIYQLISTLQECFKLKNCEFTVECNVGNATDSKLTILKDLGVTRISTGIQTFDNEQRKKLHIQKNSNDIVKWIENARKYQFEQISTDLIYGLPDTRVEHFLKDLKKAINLSLDHISVYKLAAFAYTKLYKDVERGKYVFPSATTVEKIFYEAHQFLIDNNFVLQSTQEYGKKGSKVKFWELTYDGYGDNLSFGVSSFGYMNGYCYQNETDIYKYIEKINSHMLPIERISPRINDIQLQERALVMGFRKGFVAKDMFYYKFKKQISELFIHQIENQIKEGLLKERKNCYQLTPKGLYYQGFISTEYMTSTFKNASSLKKKMCIGTHEMP